MNLHKPALIGLTSALLALGGATSAIASTVPVPASASSGAARDLRARVRHLLVTPRAPRSASTSATARRGSARRSR